MGKVAPNYRVCGPKLGPKTQELKKVLEQFTEADILKLKFEKKYAVYLGEDKYDLQLEDVIFSEKKQ